MIVDVLVHVHAVCFQLKGWGICVLQNARSDTGLWWNNHLDVIIVV